MITDNIALAQRKMQENNQRCTQSVKPAGFARTPQNAYGVVIAFGLADPFKCRGSHAAPSLAGGCPVRRLGILAHRLACTPGWTKRWASTPYPAWRFNGFEGGKAGRAEMGEKRRAETKRKMGNGKRRCGDAAWPTANLLRVLRRFAVQSSWLGLRRAQPSRALASWLFVTL